MASSPGSDLLIRVALDVGWAAALLTATLVLAISLLRALRVRAERRRARLLATWRPLLMSALGESNPPLPVVARRDRLAFLLLWNHLHESLRGEAKSGLNRIALRLGMERTARALALSPDVRQRLVGALTLGNLRDPHAWDGLLDLALHGGGPSGLAAAQALFRIDPARAARALVPTLGARSDWSKSRVLSLLREAGRAVVSEPLARALAAVPAQEAVRLLEYAAAAEPAALRPVLMRRLRQSRDPEVIAACLRQLHDPRDADVVREHLAHPVWFVRGQALRRLHPHATAADVPALMALLADPEWWVRLRAAEVLASLPSTATAAALAAAPAEGRDLVAQVRATEQER